MDLANGIRLHRSIDGFADAYARAHECIRLFPPEFRRFGAIVLDVAFDHILARSWDEFSTLDLNAFVLGAYEDIQATSPLAPAPAQEMIKHMVSHDWLKSYRDPMSVSRMLDSISRRLKRDNPLAEANWLVGKFDREIEQTFRVLRPELIAFARSKASDAVPYARVD
jgi:acyl carrier protein phosphodiesterase